MAIKPFFLENCIQAQQAAHTLLRKPLINSFVRLQSSKPNNYVATRCRSVALAQCSSSSLSQDQISFFESEGYLVLEDFASAEECRQLRSRAGEIVEEFQPGPTTSIFSSKNQKDKTDEYFLDSASNISCFFEEKAFDSDGALTQDKSLSINKIGHALHDLDPAFQLFSRSPQMAAVASAVGFANPTPVQSMYIFKQPHIGGECIPHQDTTFLYTEPHSCVGFWFALQDATLQNGCLWVLPKSHTSGVTRRMLLTEDRRITFEGSIPEFQDDKFIPVQVKEGTLVLLHGALWHKSFENTSEKSRHAYTVHFVEGSNKWDPQNWLQRSGNNPFKPLERIN
eukprot:CAMPEP_0196580662 /NCGR_PEP_ID=MMETSP1081-20130531/29884_1 /TAXON_ID=36882 /ORGANISM="Pyramimonas amylifera, Strain CCMP720" /LENGTH=338 /DNA_ID=CAMNT_0041900587 /DNA_START=83 /DNA_END=1099 /DNA_ORIENTATION=+